MVDALKLDCAPTLLYVRIQVDALEVEDAILKIVAMVQRVLARDRSPDIVNALRAPEQRTPTAPVFAFLLWKDPARDTVTHRCTVLSRV
jgi:hypothetical protein